MSHSELESQTVVAFMEWRADPTVSIEMRLKDGTDTWGKPDFNDDCWWRHCYYRLKPSASVPPTPPYIPPRSLTSKKPRPLLPGKAKLSEPLSKALEGLTK